MAGRQRKRDGVHVAQRFLSGTMRCCSAGRSTEAKSLCNSGRSPEGERPRRMRESRRSKRGELRHQTLRKIDAIRPRSKLASGGEALSLCWSRFNVFPSHDRNSYIISLPFSGFCITRYYSSPRRHARHHDAEDAAAGVCCGCAAASRQSQRPSSQSAPFIAARPAREHRHTDKCWRP